MLAAVLRMLNAFGLEIEFVQVQKDRVVIQISFPKL